MQPLVFRCPLTLKSPPSRLLVQVQTLVNGEAVVLDMKCGPANREEAPYSSPILADPTPLLTPLMIPLRPVPALCRALFLGVTL